MKRTRRLFFKKSLSGLLLLVNSNMVNAKIENDKKYSQQRKNPFHLGMAGYSFLKFDIDTTLKTLQRLDIHYLCIKDFHLPYNCTDEQIKDFHQKCNAHNVIGYAVGPINMKSEKDVDAGFAYAKRVGVTKIIGVPTYELLPYIESKVKEYNFHFAIHLHGPSLPIFPNAKDVWEHTKDLDPRMGICLDIGHDARSGYSPVEDLKKYHSRIFDMHIKDVTDYSKNGHTIEIGRGVLDFTSLIKTMRDVNYTGMCSLEFDKDKDDPFMGIAESIGYFKALCDNI